MTQADGLLILPSPLLGTTAYGPLATALDATVAALPSPPFSPQEVLTAFVTQARATRATILVPHSNAGLYAPRVADEVGARAVVSVDAALPRVEGGATPLAPPAFLETIRGFTGEDGMLPPWTSWWPAEEMLALFPDSGWFERVAASAPRLPLAYFEDTLLCPPGWAARPNAYLAFGDTYGAELALARSSGWSAEVMVGHHLHLLVDPDGVATVVRSLLEKCATDGLHSPS